MSLWIKALAVLGAATAIKYSMEFTYFLYWNYLATCNMKKRYGKAGDWAVVTGASEGIGHAMAMDLGKRGFNVCVIARTQSKLDELVKDLQKLNVKGLAISFDVANATEDQWQSLFHQLDKLNIAVFVNNVGVCYSYPHYFHKVDLSEDIRMLKINCESTMRMTKYILPNMIQKRCGAIVNLSSVSSLLPAPLLATYAASKSFVKSFS